MCTSVRTIPFTERNTRSFTEHQRERHWLQMYLPASLSEPVDVTKYGVIYGGVQKNIGPAGVVIVIIQRGSDHRGCASRHTDHASVQDTCRCNDSLYNTPPAYGIYICGKVFKWLKKMGGLDGDEGAQ